MTKNKVSYLIRTTFISYAACEIIAWNAFSSLLVKFASLFLINYEQPSGLVDNEHSFNLKVLHEINVSRRLTC